MQINLNSEEKKKEKYKLYLNLQRHLFSSSCCYFCFYNCNYFIPYGIL